MTAEETTTTYNKAASDQDDADLNLLSETVNALYHDGRKAYKRMRAEHMGEATKSPAPPLHRAFDTLFAFVEQMQADPELLSRLRDEALPRWKAAQAQREEREQAQRGQKDAPAPFIGMTTAQISAITDAMLNALEDYAAAVKAGEGNEQAGEQIGILNGLYDAAEQELSARQ